MAATPIKFSHIVLEDAINEVRSISCVLMAMSRSDAKAVGTDAVYYLASKLEESADSLQDQLDAYCAGRRVQRQAPE